MIFSQATHTVVLIISFLVFIGTIETAPITAVVSAMICIMAVRNGHLWEDEDAKENA